MKREKCVKRVRNVVYAGKENKVRRIQVDFAEKCF
jgi:hypothetical protein